MSTFPHSEISAVSTVEEEFSPFDMARTELEAFFLAHQHSAYRAKQLMQWCYRRGVADIASMTDLSKSLRQWLDSSSRFVMPNVRHARCSADGTRKWLFSFADNSAIETVYIKEPDRGTLCVSSQVGCPLRCDFCATGAQGFTRNLSTSEIIAQLWRVKQELGDFPEAPERRQVSNVVFMGMGEPLLNADAVFKAISIMLDQFGFGLSKRRVTLSTVGVLPGIIRFAKESEAALAVSLHAAHDALRNELVPINRSYPLANLIQTCRTFADLRCGEWITFEYVMLAGINDTAKDAKQLTTLLSGLPCKINLIPHNSYEGSAYTSSTQADIDAFRAILMDKGFVTITRRPRGADIMAACGQLAGDTTAMSPPLFALQS